VKVLWREHRPGEDFWIGLHKVTRWYDGDPSTYRNWLLSESEPDESNVCVRYSEGGFRDKQCNHDYRYICKKAAGTACLFCLSHILTKQAIGRRWRNEMPYY